MTDFIYIDSDGGRFGRIRWLNSNTMPHWDPLCCRMVRRWGGWGFDPDPACYLNGMEIEPNGINIEHQVDLTEAMR